MSRQHDFRLNRRLFMTGATAAATLLPAATLLRPSPAGARAPLGGRQVAAWYRFRIGDFEATVVSDGPLILGDPREQFPSADPAVVEELLVNEFLPTDITPLEQNCLIVNTGEQLILFDNGMGSDQAFGPHAGRLLASIEAAGFSGAQFDALVISHAHCDHCWGIMADDGSPNFPNAQIYISQADFDFWTDEAKLSADGFLPFFVEGARRNLLPNRDRLHFFADGEEFLYGIQAHFTPGHTVGHTSFIITSNGDSGLYVGDVVHHSTLLFKNPTWEFAFDTDPAAAAETRVKLFDMASTDRLRLFGYHFPFPGIGHIAPDGAGYRYIPTPMDLRQRG